MVLVECFSLSILDGLVERTQLGGYRPRVQMMEEEMRDVIQRTESAYNGTSSTPAEDVMVNLKEKGYCTVSWNGGCFLASTYFII